MAKKKKIELSAEPASDSVKYSGNVTAIVMKGSKKVKTQKINNTGVSRLFKGIASALVGVSDLRDFIPKYLGLAYREPELLSVTTRYTQTTLTSNNIIRVPITPLNIREIETPTRNAWVAPFEATIPSSLLQSLSYKVNELGLYGDANSETLLARIVVTGDNESEVGALVVDPGMTLIIQWEITIENK